MFFKVITTSRIGFLKRMHENLVTIFLVSLRPWKKKKRKEYLKLFVVNFSTFQSVRYSMIGIFV